jgi:hypothetical protein
MPRDARPWPGANIGRVRSSATTGRDDAPGSAAVAGPVLRPTSTRRRRRGGSTPRVARLGPGRCWAGFRRAAMVWRVGAVVNVATAPLTAGPAAVAVARMFASHLSGRAGSGVHARGAAEAGFVIVFSPPFVWPEPVCGHRRSLPELRYIELGARSADPGGPVAFRAFPLYLPGEARPPTRALPVCLPEKPSASLAHLPGALARVDFPPVPVLRCCSRGKFRLSRSALRPVGRVVPGPGWCFPRAS